MGCHEKYKLMNFITEVSFALDDVVLYLDTHPSDKEAMLYYEKYAEMREEAVADYERKFGPLRNTAGSMQEGKFNWVHGPWPWENGFEGGKL